jgi:hypothetical protein
MIKEIKKFQIANIQGYLTAIREVDGEENLYEADFVFDTSVDICAINGQDLVDYMESLNLEWRLITE